MNTKIIQDTATFIFTFAVTVLTIVSALGVWNFFSHDVIAKSFETVGLLVLVAGVIMTAIHFLGSGNAAIAEQIPNSAFKSIREITLVVLVTSASILAFIGVLSIWNIITDHEMLYKSIGSLAILAFGSYLIVVMCMERENNPLLKQQGVSVGGAVLAIVLLYVIFAFSGLFF